MFSRSERTAVRSKSTARIITLAASLAGRVEAAFWAAAAGRWLGRVGAVSRPRVRAASRPQCVPRVAACRTWAQP